MAESFARQSIDNYDRLNDAVGRAFAMKRLGTIYRSSQEYSKSITAFKEAMEIYRQHSDDLQVAEI